MLSIDLPPKTGPGFALVTRTAGMGQVGEEEAHTRADQLQTPLSRGQQHRPVVLKVSFDRPLHPKTLPPGALGRLPEKQRRPSPESLPGAGAFHSSV